MSKTSEPTNDIPQLPYKEITEIASYRDRREIIRQYGGTASELFYLDYSRIRVRESEKGFNQGFNKRIRPEGISDDEWLQMLEIPHLASLLRQYGQQTPVEGDLLPDGYFYLTEGYRRYLAIGMLLNEGFNEYPMREGRKEPIKVNMVECRQNPFGYTEKDRFLRIFTSQDILKLKDIEMAVLIHDFKEYFRNDDGSKFTNAQIADHLGKSRQYVDNMLRLYQQPDDIKQKLLTGEITKTALVDLTRTVRTETELSHVVEEEVAKKGKVKVKAAHERRKKDDAYEGMPTIDCSQEKTDAILKVNNSVGLADKINTRLENLAIPKQHKEDLQRMCEFIAKDLGEVRELIQKMPDKR